MAAPAAAPSPGPRRRQEKDEGGGGHAPTSPRQEKDEGGGRHGPTSPGLLTRAWDGYTAALASHPLRTRALTAGSIAFAADALAQALSPRPAPNRRSLTGLRRSAAWFAWGALVSGPAGHAWQGLLDSVWPPPPPPSQQAPGAPRRPPPPTAASVLAKRVAADAAVFSPAINAAALAFIATVIERAGPRSAPAALRARFWPTQAAGWRLWPAASAVAYALIPPRFRVLFFNAVGFWWTLFLATRSGGGGNSAEAGKRRKAAVA